jgi:hypothetical protein
MLNNSTSLDDETGERGSGKAENQNIFFGLFRTVPFPVVRWCPWSISDLAGITSVTCGFFGQFSLMQSPGRSLSRSLFSSDLNQIRLFNLFRIFVLRSSVITVLLARLSRSV